MKTVLNADLHFDGRVNVRVSRCVLNGEVLNLHDVAAVGASDLDAEEVAVCVGGCVCVCCGVLRVRVGRGRTWGMRIRVRACVGVVVVLECVREGSGERNQGSEST